MAQVWLVISTIAIAKVSFPLDLSSDYGSEFSWPWTPGWSCLLYFTIQSGAYPGWFNFFTSQFLMIISNLLATSQCWFVKVLYNPHVLPFPMVFMFFFASVCVNSPLMHSWTHPAKRWGERSPPLVAPGVPGRSLKNSVTVSPMWKKKSHLLGYNINNDLFNGMCMYWCMYIHMICIVIIYSQQYDVWVCPKNGGYLSPLLQLQC